MPPPNKETICHDSKVVKRRTRWRRPPEFVVGLVAIVALISLYWRLILPVVDVTENDADLIGGVKANEAANLATKIDVRPLPHEEMLKLPFQKSCLPQTNNKCMTFIPPDNGSKQRVALLAPPGDMTNAFHGLLELVIGSARNANMEILHSSHIPPYGYGKTHGLTRIIRVVPHPFLMGATDTLHASLGQDQTLHDITLQDLKAALRQQIRFHCRLSHVSAHTAMWTLNASDLIKSSLKDLVVQIQAFLGLDEVPLSTNGEFATPGDMGAKFPTILANGATLLTDLQSSSGEDIDLYQALDQVLLKELAISKNLTAWPCESFWTVEGTSSITEKISAAMSPNCSAPFTSCFVKRDKCEARGDGKCA